MHVHRSEIAQIVLTPYGFKQLVAAVYLAGVFHEKLKQIKFLHGKANVLAVKRCTAAAYVYAQPVCAQFHFGRFAVRTSAAQYALYPGLYLQYVEGLCHVIVRAVFKAEYFVHILALGGEHYYGNVARFAHYLANLYSAELWQHNVQQHQIIMLAVQLF